MNKKIMVGILLMFFFTAVSAYAKPKHTPTQKELTADDIVAKMKVQLGLTDTQAIDVKPIVENYLADEQQIRLEEKKQLSKVLTGQQLFTWNFLQNEVAHKKKN